MDIGVFSLVLFAAFTHALWNFFSKKSSGNLQVTLLGLWMADLTLLPISLWIISGEGITLTAAGYMAKTALAHILYYFCLNMAYRSGDISTVYPVARGTGIAGTAVAAWLLLGESFSSFGVAGISLIFSGVLAISIRKSIKRTDARAILYALGVGCSTIIYSINDKAGVAHANPLVYLNLKDMMALAVMTPFVFRGGFAEAREILARKWKYSAAIGYGSLGTYLMILYAFTLERAGYISAVREFSIVIGSIFGIVFLREKLTPGKIAGIILVFSGLIFIKLS